MRPAGGLQPASQSLESPFVEKIQPEEAVFFAQRHRKMELLRGTAVQPGQHIFFIAGETQIRSAADLKKYITEHGGVVANELNDTVEYVVAGTGLDKKFFEETVKAKGLKVIREDELPRFFGLE